MRDLSNITATDRVVLRTALFLLLALGIFPSSGQAQLYFDIPVQFDYYRTDTDELNFSRRGAIFNPSICMVVAGNDSSKIEVHVGIGIFFSKFNQEVGSSTFEFNAIGPFQTTATAYYNFSNKIQAGLGVSFGWYAVNEKGIQFNLDPEYPDRLGDGYSTLNFGNNIDARYNINETFSIGAKFTYWYLPLLEYVKIGNYGDFKGSQKDLYLTRLEFSVRVFLNSRQYNRK